MSVNIGDIDRDGLPDLVIGNFYTGNSISVLRMTPALSRQIFVEPDSLAFGWVRAGARDTMVVTVTNAGVRDSLRVGPFTSTCAQFSVQSGPGVIPPLGSLSFSVMYAPASAGPDTGSLLIKSSDSLNPVVSVRLAGHSYRLANEPVLFSIAPAQYGQARIIWFRSLLDTAGASDPVIQYSLWRIVPGSVNAGPTALPDPDIRSARALIGPLWDFVGTIPAVGFERYTTLATTFMDYSLAGTANVFIVAAHSKNGSVYLSVPDTLLVRSGQITEVGGAGNPPGAGKYLLEQNYPNPFNPSTTIRYALPERGVVSLAVFNSLGQEVASLVEGSQEPGYHEVRFDGSSLSSGVYFYRLRAGEAMLTRSLVLVR